MKTDIHSHLLPGIDDGAQSTAQAEGILKALLAQGTDCLAFTPHFYPAHMTIDRFLRHRQDSRERLEKSPVLSSFHVSFGAEVYLTRALLNHEDPGRLCYTGTKLLLTELEYNVPFSTETERRLEWLINDWGLTPVLAHIERYPFLLSDPGRVVYLREMGCLCQMNLQSLGEFWKRRRMLTLIQAGMVDFLGEDLHQAALPDRLKGKLLQLLEKAYPGFVADCDAFSWEMIFS